MQDKESVREMMKRTSELVSLTSRDLKFEVHDEAGIVQVQVIDTTDGRIVRKIPSDEVLKLVTALKEKMTERVDVKACPEVKMQEKIKSRAFFIWGGPVDLYAENYSLKMDISLH
jgi:hypothetical protein